MTSNARRSSSCLLALLSALLLAAASGCAVDPGEEDEPEEINEVDENGEELLPPIATSPAPTPTYTTCGFGPTHGACSCAYADSGATGDVIEDSDIRGLYYWLYRKWGSRTSQVQGRVKCTKGSTSYYAYGSWVSGSSQASCRSGYVESASRCRVRVRH